MNPGDRLKIRIFDNKAAGALETSVQDLTTGRTGYMLASAANGFANTSIATCDGTPWSFRPLYSTASTANQGGWAVANINVAYEVGHFEPCTSLAEPSRSVGNYNDPSWNLCDGPYENTRTGHVVKRRARRRALLPGGRHPRPVEFSAGPGDRLHLRADLDYDGTSYWRDWPDSTHPGMFPSPLLISQPSTVHGAPYPQMQFLTDNPATNSECSPTATAACVVPPPQAPGGFYPYWTLASGRAAGQHGGGASGSSGR